MKRRKQKRRNPMASVARQMKPKRIPSGREYRRTEKHRKPLRDRQSEAVFRFIAPAHNSGARGWFGEASRPAPSINSDAD